MNQVFVSNHMSGISDNSHQSWSTLAHTTGAAAGHEACMVGVWDPINSRFLDGTTAALGLISPLNVAAIGEPGKGFADVMQQGAADFVADSDGIVETDEVINVFPSSPQWLNRSFQIVQAMPSGNPIASPVINTNQVKRLRWDPNNEPVKHKVTVADAGLSAIASGDTLQMVLSVRWPQDIAYYESQINPSGSIGSLTPAVSMAFDNPKRIYKSIEYTAASAVVATEHDNFVDAIIADTADDIHKLVTVTVDSNDLVVEAKFFGQIIDVFVTKNGERSHGVSAETAAPELGVGSFAEVLSREKKAQYSLGHFNRMYLPTGGETMASKTPGAASSTETAGYDRLFIEYENANGGMPGFNRQGQYSTITLYVPNATYADQDNGLAVEATFGLIDAAGGSKEYIW